MLNGKKLGWTSLEKIDALIEEQILPYLNISWEGIENKIIRKYEEAKNKNNTLKLDDEK